MVIPGHMDDAARPILLAVTRGWDGKESLSFKKVMRQVKARLTAGNGAVEHVVVFCDGWDSPSFEEEHREELEAHARQRRAILVRDGGRPRPGDGPSARRAVRRRA